MSPDPAKAAPHKRAVRACGTRASQMMKLQLAFSTSPPMRVLSTASAGMSTDQKKRLHPTSKRMMTVRMRLYVVPLLFIYSANLLKYFNSYSGKRLGWKILINSFSTRSGWKGKSS